MPTVGRASAEITADTRKFPADLKRKLKDALSRVDIDASEIGRRIAEDIRDGLDDVDSAFENTSRRAKESLGDTEDDAKETAREVRQSLSDATGYFSDAAREMADDFEESLDDIEDATRLTAAEIKKINREIEREQKGAAREAEREIKRANREAEKAYKKAAREAEKAAKDAERAFEEAMREAEDAFQRAQREADQQFDQMARSARSAAASMVRAFGFATLIGAAAVAMAGLASATSAATTGVVSFVGALAPAVGILGALPAAIGATVAAFATLQVAMIGVSDAFEAALTGSAEEFEEAIENLAPSAQATARALRELKGPLDDLRTDVQQAFFAGLASDLENVADVLLGPIHEGMVDVADEANDVVRGFADILASGRGLEFVNTVFGITADSIDELTGPLQVLFTGLLDVATAGAEAFGGLNEGLGEAITNLGEWLSESARAGDVQEWVDNAVDVFSALGEILGDVWGILTAIFDAVETSGSDALGTIGSLLDTANEFLNSFEGQQALVEIFEGLAEVGDAVGPAFEALITGLGQIAPLVGDIAIALGPALATAIENLAIGLSEIDFGSVAEGLGDLAGTVSGLLQPLGRLLDTLTGPLGDALSGIADGLEPVVEAFDNLLSGGNLEVLEEFFGVLAGLIETVAELFGEQLAGSIEAFGEPLFEILEPLGELIEALEPLIELLFILGQLLGPFNPLIQALLEPLGELIELYLRFYTAIIEFVNPAIEFLRDLIRDGLIAAGRELGDATEALTEKVVDAWNGMKSGVSDAVNAITGFARGMRDDIRGAFNNVVGFIQDLPSRISDAASGMFNGIWNAFKGAINLIIDAWNGISFTIGGGSYDPLGDFGPTVSVPSFTLSTPPINRLQRGGLTTEGGLAFVDPGEVHLPLEDQRVTDLLSDALNAAMADGRGGSDGAFMPDVGSLLSGLSVQVFVGSREITDIVDVRIADNNRELRRSARSGSGVAL